MAYNTLVYQRFSLGGIIQLANLSTTDTTLYVKFYDLKDPDQIAIDPSVSTINELVLNVDYSNCEIIKVDSMSYSSTTGITTVSINATGRNMPKYGAGAGSDTGNAHYINDEVACVWTHRPTEILNRKMAGVEATGYADFKMGNETAADQTFWFYDDQANPSFIRKDSATGTLVYSNNGVDTLPMGGDNVYTGGDGLSLTAGDFDIDLTDTVIFKSIRTDNETRVPITLSATGKIDTSFITAGNLADYIGDVTATMDEINQALDGISANVTAANLNTVTAGSSSNADALHSHQTPTKSYVAGESISTDDAVCLLPYAYEKFTQTSEDDITLGDTNATRKISTEITPAKDVSNLTTLYIRGNEAAASTMTLTVTIETDNGGEPSGTPVTNGTANTIDTSTWGASYASRTVTFGSAVTLAAGTTYHIVLSVDKTDAANYLNIGYCDARDPGYHSFTGDVYDLDTGTWSAGTAFYWWTTSGQDLGCKIYKTDANVPWKTYKFCGFAKAGGSAEADIDVYYDIVPDLSSLKPTENYFLSETAGAITHSPPGTINTDQVAAENAYRIGYALDDGTSLKIQPGEKRAILYEKGLATETIQLVCGFRPVLIRAYSGGGGEDGGSAGGAVGLSYAESQSEKNVGFDTGYMYEGVNAAIATLGTGGNEFKCETSHDSVVGFTLTCTETNAAGFYIMMEVIG